MGREVQKAGTAAARRPASMRQAERVSAIHALDNPSPIHSSANWGPGPGMAGCVKGVPLEVKRRWLSSAQGLCRSNPDCFPSLELARKRLIRRVITCIMDAACCTIGYLCHRRDGSGRIKECNRACGGFTGLLAMEVACEQMNMHGL